MAFDYLLLPLQGPLIDWNCIKSVLIQNNSLRDMHIDGSSPKCHGHLVHTKNGLVCTCMLQNSLVYTPHNGFMYCITGTLGDLDGNSFLIQNDDEYVTYKEYNERKSVLFFSFQLTTDVFTMRDQA